MDPTVNKLTLLYICEQMEIPVTADTLNDMCCSKNMWLSYMTLSEILPQLVETNFLSFSETEDTRYYKITQEGRKCLQYFYSKIPASTRDDISAFIRENRLSYKRNQEYSSDYKKNKDGTYSVILKITDPAESKLELKLSVDSYTEAINIYKKWGNCASKVYAEIYKILIEGE